ncbi:hypothetical protein UPYG_G00273050 [Umbra pygmaea]|uniref:Uncharacterized protein n=1 Tax=Umbra pygmaea TaxID=75934 RepID=A0ABD0WTF2_UMBPY
MRVGRLVIKAVKKKKEEKEEKRRQEEKAAIENGTSSEESSSDEEFKEIYQKCPNAEPSRRGRRRRRSRGVGHIPPLASLWMARHDQRLSRLQEVNIVLYKMVMSLDFDPNGENLLTMRALPLDHQHDLTTGTSKETHVCRLLVAESILEGNAAIMLKKTLIMANPETNWKLRQDAGLAGDEVYPGEGTRRRYNKGSIRIVKRYHKRGIINSNDKEQLISWVREEQYLNRDTTEYKQIRADIKRHFKQY